MRPQLTNHHYLCLCVLLLLSPRHSDQGGTFSFWSNWNIWYLGQCFCEVRHKNIRICVYILWINFAQRSSFAFSVESTPVVVTNILAGKMALVLTVATTLLLVASPSSALTTCPGFPGYCSEAFPGSVKTCIKINIYIKETIDKSKNTANTIL